MTRSKRKTELEIKKEQAFKLYKSIKKVYCPALKTHVYFTRWGWNHIVQKKGRSGKEQIKRLDKLSYVKQIIITASVISEVRQLNEYTTYRINETINSRNIGIIIFKKLSTYYFVSII
ncbi:MAG TPA: hypothetical protein PLS49_04085 [Candidatus Woesebacteria bacterium]|nr:hypothetical protein [Candidatus Woesebacteria bacterium]